MRVGLTTIPRYFKSRKRVTENVTNSGRNDKHDVKNALKNNNHSRTPTSSLAVPSLYSTEVDDAIRRFSSQKPVNKTINLTIKENVKNSTQLRTKLGQKEERRANSAKYTSKSSSYARMQPLSLGTPSLYSTEVDNAIMRFSNQSNTKSNKKIAKVKKTNQINRSTQKISMYKACQNQSKSVKGKANKKWSIDEFLNTMNKLSQESGRSSSLRSKDLAQELETIAEDMELDQIKMQGIPKAKEVTRRKSSHHRSISKEEQLCEGFEIPSNGRNQNEVKCIEINSSKCTHIISSVPR